MRGDTEACLRISFTADMLKKGNFFVVEVMESRTLVVFAAILSVTLCSAASNPKDKESFSSSAEVDGASASVPVLEEFSVTAMRFGDDAFNLPVSARNIDSETISESGLPDLPDILRRYADVYFRNLSGSTPTNAEISMRGFGANSSQRVLVLVDGQRLNRADMSSINWSQVPLGQIENIEVMRGPQSAVYGNHAVGGVIKINTKRWGQGDSADFGGGYGSFDEYSAWGRINRSTDDYFAGADVNYYHDGGYVDYSGSWSKSAGAVVGAKLNDAVDADFRATFADEYISWGNQHTSYGDMMARPRYSSGVNFKDYLDYITLAGRLNSTTSSGVGALEIGANMKKKHTDYVNYGSTADSTLWTASATPHYRFFVDGDDNLWLEGGFDFYYDHLRTKGSSSYSSYRVNTERLTLAPWIGGKCQLDDVFSLNAGGRYEYAMNNSSDVFDSSNDAYKNLNGLAAQFGINAKLDDRWNLYFRFDQIYHYPALDEMMGLYGYAADSSPAPERGQNYEIGTNYVRGPWRAGASLFYMHMDGEIDYNPLGGIWNSGANENIGNTDRYGVELRAAYEGEVVGASSSWTFMSSHFSDGMYKGRNIPLVPSIVSTSMAWVRPVRFARLDIAYMWTCSQYMASDFSNSFQRIPEAWSIDLTANFFIGGNVRAFVSVQNVTDETYATYAAYSVYAGQAWYASPGRTIRAGVEIRF